MNVPIDKSQRKINIFADYAPKIYENGFSVVPCDGKKPVVSYNEYRDKCATQEEMDDWCDKYPSLNIGLVTGKFNKIVFVDIDTTDLELTAKCRSLLPASPIVRFGQKGFALAVKYSGQHHRKINFKGALIGEIISNTQVIIPPSVHPVTKKPFSYLSYMSFDSFSKEDIYDQLPNFTDSDLFKFERDLEGLANNFDMNVFTATVGRNDRLKTLCGSLFETKLTKDEIAKRLFVEDKILHPDNPLFSDKAEFGSRASKPMINAIIFVDSIFKTYVTNKIVRGEPIRLTDPNDEPTCEFEIYREFFKRKFPNVRKDTISKVAMVPSQYKRIWHPVENKIRELQSDAITDKIKKTNVEIHLSKWIDELPLDLMIDIPKWDRIDRIKQLEPFVRFKNCSFSEFEAILKLWGSGIFKRLDDSMYQNKCLIFKGDQGIGKDHFIKSLLDGFGPYYTKFTSNRAEVEAWDQVCSNLVVHIEEFDQTSRLTVPFLKDLVTRDMADYRAPYAKKAEKRRCYGSFISSVNIDDILRDTSGNRRFVVFDVESIDWAYPKDESLLVIAQFKYYADNGFDLDINVDAVQDKINEKFQPEDMEENILELWDQKLNDPSFSVFHGKDLKLNDVTDIIDEMRKLSQFSQRRILSLLRRTGRSQKTRTGATYIAGCHKPVADNPEF